MEISFDRSKNEKNIRERGLPFSRAAEFDFQTSAVAVDARHDYGEARYVAVGYLDGRLHVLGFAETSDGIRVISSSPAPWSNASARLERAGKNAWTAP